VSNEQSPTQNPISSFGKPENLGKVVTITRQLDIVVHSMYFYILGDMCSSFVKTDKLLLLDIVDFRSPPTVLHKTSEDASSLFDDYLYFLVFNLASLRHPRVTEGQAHFLPNSVVLFCFSFNIFTLINN